MSAKFNKDVQEACGAASKATLSLLSRVQKKQVSRTAFHELNGDRQLIVGHKYLVGRSAGAVESWVLMHIDQANHMLMFMCC